MNQTLLTLQNPPKKICVRCNQEIDGIICWKVFKWAAIRFSILTVICIPGLFFLQYEIGIIWASGIGIWALFFFLVMLCSCHSQTPGPGLERELREQREIQEMMWEKQEKEFEKRQKKINKENNIQWND
ncbi:unnamed protein product [Paramecium pentaurelia]|uniref:Uncharacterized protein n=1 Tax=Paramecium pentaurelia TaxID=43138 RepID=A0A8S1WNI0_9CILI|nr:unnamed protein product [Paramecium pentaurelia]